MRQDLALSVNRVSKVFRLGRRQNDFPTLRETIAAGFSRAARRLVSGPRARDGNAAETIRALDDVSFEVRKGEVVGIIGANGAGKSTLLKVLSRITLPTEGRAEIRGRLGSLLEVGTGFHLELTGRENVFLNGAILGMTRREIRRRFDEIVAFSEVERFIDTPVKFYSSGMYLRLAFAVAAHLEPEILLVDEVLAVGDAAFQQKCLGKMDDVARQGRTILFVSHNMLAMESLCDRVLWLQEGRIVEDGRTDRVITNYLRTFARTVTEQVWSDRSTAPGNELVRMQRACIRPQDGEPADVISVRTPLVLEFEYWSEDPGARLVPSIHVFNDQGIVVFNVGPTDPAPWQRRSGGAALVRDVCRIPGDLLNDGAHRISFCLCRGHELVYCHDDVLVFDVRDTAAMRDAWYGKWVGAVRPALEWRTEALDSAAALPRRTAR
jgi:lipopolysaccharide transport system ATP-binding protein